MSEAACTQPSPAPVVLLERVWKTYGEEAAAVHALRGVSLRIEPAEFVAIMGPSGSGKTTLMEIMGCLSRPSAGRYRFLGHALDGVAARGLAVLRGQCIGFVFQSFNLLPRLTALENVELPMVYRGVRAALRRRRAVESLTRVGLAHRLRHLPSELSGGECQRVAVARALVNRPSLILADEPTGNLDSGTGGEILRLLCKLNTAGNTVVIVTHDPKVAARAERRIELQDGRVVSDQPIPRSDPC